MSRDRRPLGAEDFVSSLRRSLSPAALVPLVATLLLGAFGGWLFDIWNMPLAWMIGAMVFTTVAALAGAPLRGSRRLRTVMIPILGVMLGSAFTPEAVAAVHKWVPSLSAMIVFIVAVVACVCLFLYRVMGYGIITSYFSASPGGLATMVVIGADLGGDERTISLTHSVRILLTVLIIPFWFRLFEGYVPGGLAVLGGVADIAPIDGALLLGCAVIGFPGARLLRIPSAQLVGPMVLSAAVHLAGITSAKPPVEIVNIAQVVIGAGIGARFTGVALTRVFRTMAGGAANTVFMLVLAAVFAFGLAAATGLPFRALWLSFAPGGLAEMTLISLAMGIDPAMVSTHHLLRVLFMVFSAPLVFGLLKRRFGITEDRPAGGD